MYNNYGARGHGNIAKITSYLHRTGEQDVVAAVQLQFESGGNHFVTPNQLAKYYSPIDTNARHTL